MQPKHYIITYSCLFPSPPVFCFRECHPPLNPFVLCPSLCVVSLIGTCRQNVAVWTVASSACTGHPPMEICTPK